MKTIIFLICCLPLMAYSQITFKRHRGQDVLEMASLRGIEYNKAIDTSYLVVSYLYHYTKDTLDPYILTDKQILQIGMHGTKYYSYFASLSDSLAFKARQEKKDRYKMLQLKDKEVAISVDYFKNYQTNKTIVNAQFQRNSYQYEDDIPKIDWTIQEDTLNILSYKCQKAITRFRGRDWVAWFAIDIPISEGPWKLTGLPGLILKTYDVQNLFIFEATAIEKRSEPIYYVDIKYINILRSKLAKIDRYRHEDVVGYFLNEVSMELTFSEGQPKAGDIKLPYIPMELE